MSEAVFAEAKTRKGYRARRKMIHAAARIFAERGKEGTSVLAVCEAAGVARTSFYNYFDTVDALVDTLASELVSDFSQGIEDTYHGMDRGEERLAGCVRFILERSAADPTWALLGAQLDMSTATMRTVFDIGARPDVEASIERGAFSISRRDIPAYLTLVRSVVMTTGRDLANKLVDRATIPQTVTMLLCGGGMERTSAQRLASKRLPKAASAVLKGTWPSL